MKIYHKDNYKTWITSRICLTQDITTIFKKLQIAELKLVESVGMRVYLQNLRWTINVPHC